MKRLSWLLLLCFHDNLVLLLLLQLVGLGWINRSLDDRIRSIVRDFVLILVASRIITDAAWLSLSVSTAFLAATRLAFGLVYNWSVLRSVRLARYRRSSCLGDNNLSRRKLLEVLVTLALRLPLFVGSGGWLIVFKTRGKDLGSLLKTLLCFG